MEIKSKLLRRGSQIPYKVFHKGGREHYNVRIYVDARPDELTAIRTVEYTLHPSFRNAHRVSTDQDRHFAIEIWTWGMFDIDVTVTFEDGATKEMKHYVEYSLPADDGSNYIEV